jgi:hypothetical protein
MFDPSTPEGQRHLAIRRRNVCEARAHAEELERKRRRSRTNHSALEV